MEFIKAKTILSKVKYDSDWYSVYYNIYKSLGVNVRFKTYEDAHTPLLATEDIEDEIKEITKGYQK